MRRRTFDIILTAVGGVLAVGLLIAGGLLTWGYHFANSTVHDQLAAEQIFFPAKGSPAIAAPEFAAMKQYAGQQLVTGAQAQVYADHFIANHLKAAGGGKTNAQLSSAAMADPTNNKLAGQVETMFKGETLRGLLLNAYAFDTMGTIAFYAAIAAFAGAAVLLVLSLLGLWHSGKVAENVTVFDGSHEAITPATA